MIRGRVIKDSTILPVRVSGDIWIGPSEVSIRPEEAEILPPAVPSKIVCVGRNYRAHAKELGNPVPDSPLLFLKPPSAVIAHGEAIRLPRDSERVEYEGEIAVVMRRTCRHLSADEDPMNFVAGFTPLNDVTARDLQKRDVQFTRGKGFDTFCPFGPWLAEGLNWEDLTVETRLNGEIVQEGTAGQMIFPIPDLIRFIARIMTLYPGDIIATGTPAGVGVLSPGDRVSVSVGGVTLENPVEKE